MSKVDRAVLQRDGVRERVRADGHGHLLMPDEAVAASLASMLSARSAGEPVWVFGYGSLIWSPMLRFAEQRVARIRGYHRGFYLWSKVNRGTPDVPGLVLGLDRGGACAGVAYRIDEDGLEHELALLWRREMLMGTYVPRWVKAQTPNGAVRAIAFVVDRSKPGYAGRLHEDEIVGVVARAHGQYGSCAEYLVSTVEGLQRHGIADTRMLRLRRMLDALRIDTPTMT
jgi:cation transport protein ChaC